MGQWIWQSEFSYLSKSVAEPESLAGSSKAFQLEHLMNVVCFYKHFKHEEITAVIKTKLFASI